MPKDDALDVFESLDPVVQGELVGGLRDEEVMTLFEGLDPDDRVWLMDEIPATVAGRLLHGLSIDERRLTASVLGYPKDSVGRRMSPEFVSAHGDFTVGQTIARVRERAADAETVYTIAVVDSSRVVIGVVELKDLLVAKNEEIISSIMVEPEMVSATDGDESAARRLTDLGSWPCPLLIPSLGLLGFLRSTTLRAFSNTKRAKMRRVKVARRISGVPISPRPFWTLRDPA